MVLLVSSSNATHCAAQKQTDSSVRNRSHRSLFLFFVCSFFLFLFPARFFSFLPSFLSFFLPASSTGISRRRRERRNGTTCSACARDGFPPTSTTGRSSAKLMNKGKSRPQRQPPLQFHTSPLMQRCDSVAMRTHMCTSGTQAIQRPAPASSSLLTPFNPRRAPVAQRAARCRLLTSIYQLTPLALYNWNKEKRIQHKSQTFDTFSTQARLAIALVHRRSPFGPLRCPSLKQTHIHFSAAAD